MKGISYLLWVQHTWVLCFYPSVTDIPLSHPVSPLCCRDCFFCLCNCLSNPMVCRALWHLLLKVPSEDMHCPNDPSLPVFLSYHCILLLLVISYSLQLNQVTGLRFGMTAGENYTVFNNGTLKGIHKLSACVPCLHTHLSPFLLLKRIFTQCLMLFKKHHAQVLTWKWKQFCYSWSPHMDQ